METSPRARVWEGAEALAPAEFHRRIESPSSLTEASRELSRFLEAHALGARTGYATELVCEELLTNIAKYAYDTSGPVQLGVTIFPDAVVLVFEDQGREFDPRLPAGAPTGLSLEETPIGGTGLRLVKKFASSLHYDRLPAGNRTEVRIARS